MGIPDQSELKGEINEDITPIWKNCHMWLIILWGLTIVLVSVTIIPVLDTNTWWIRLMDFPRLQIALAGA
jgi:hypothetical protein